MANNNANRWLVPIEQVPDHDRVGRRLVTCGGRHYIFFPPTRENEQGQRQRINNGRVEIGNNDGLVIVHEAPPPRRRQALHPPPPPLPQEPEGRKSPPPEVEEIECSISEELSADVFGNDMLREIILTYLIYPNGNRSGSDLKNLRLVRRDWLETIAKIMKKLVSPMFTLILDNGPEKKLDQFVSAMVSPSRLPDFVPPFSLKLLPEFFRRENYKSLSECIFSCGEAMTDLELLFPINSTMSLVFYPFCLQKLQRLAVQFTDYRLSVRQSAVNLNNAVTIYALQSILNGTSEFKELTFKFTSSETLIPFGFEYLALPKTITTLNLDCPLKNSDLDLLINNDLPSLTNLRLFATTRPFSGGFIFRILEKFQATLRRLCLGGVPIIRQGQNLTLLKFPLMENLEALTVRSSCWKLEVGDQQRLESQFPKMSELNILSADNTEFTKWTENSKHKTVKALVVSLWTSNFPVTITLEKMQSLHLAFPNVVSLCITLCGRPSCGLKYLFLEMRSLETLEITVKVTAGEQSPDHWDSVLIGLTPDLVASLRKNPEYVDLLEFRDNSNIPSIRNLTALKSLALTGAKDTFPFENNEPLISDLVFQLAFLKMPNLTELSLYGRFSPSAQFTERWKQEKGTEIDRD